MNVVRSFRLRCHNRGENNPTDLTVDFTIGLDALAAPPVLPGPIVRPFEGRTETQAWNLSVIDTASVITSRLADAGGRMHLLGRIVTVEMQEDGGAWATIGTARLTDISQSQGPGRYTLSLEDERWRERNTFIFTRSDTTSLWPQGLRFPFRRFPSIGTQSCLIEAVRSNVVLIEPGLLHDPLLADLEALLVGDIRPDAEAHDLVTQGNFETLRANIEGTDYEVVGFDTSYTSGGNATPGPGVTRDGDKVTDSTGRLAPFWVYWPTSQPTPGVSVDVRLYAPEHEPDASYPLHIGVQGTAHDYGTTDGRIHPFDALERAYIEAGLRFDPAAFAALKADPRYLKSAWRITSKRKTAEWAEEAIYQPNLVIPFIDNEGRIAPKAIHNPANIDPDTLFVFDASNTKAPHVTWHHGTRDAYNILRVQYQQELWVPRVPGESDIGERKVPTDRIAVTEQDLPPFEHDTVEVILPRDITVRMDGLHRGQGRGITGFIEDVASPPAALIKDHSQRFADELFEVTGDGPQTGTIHGMLSTSSVASGDLAIIDQDRLKNPNPAENARSGSRIVRIMQRTPHVDGYGFEYMDIGPALQPLAEPTIAIAQNAENPRNAVDITVSDVPAGARVDVFVGLDAAFATMLRELPGVGAGVYTVTGMPSGTTIYAAGSSHAAGRTSSLLSSPVSVVTAVDPPMVRDATLTLNADGSATLTWTVNPITLGVRIVYVGHSADADPIILANPADVDATLGTYTFPASVVTGERFSVGITPYPGFAAGAVSGTPGEQLVRSIPVVAGPAVFVTMEFFHDHAKFYLRRFADSVWVYELTVEDGADLGEPDITGQTPTVLPTETEYEVDYPDTGFVTFVYFEARGSDPSVVGQGAYFAVPGRRDVGPHLVGRPSLSVVAGDLVVTWSHLAQSLDALGVRIYYVAHDALARPPMTTFVDVDIFDGSHTFDSSLLTGTFFSLEIEVWTGFAGGSVTGLPGIIRIAMTFETTPPIFLGDAGVITHTMMDVGAIEADNVNIAELSDISDELGTIVSGLVDGELTIGDAGLIFVPSSALMRMAVVFAAIDEFTWLQIGQRSSASPGITLQSSEKVRVTGDGGLDVEDGPIDFDAAESLRLPRLTTTERNALTASAGMLIWNTTDSEFQGYDGSAWGTLALT